MLIMLTCKCHKGELYIVDDDGYIIKKIKGSINERYMHSINLYNWKYIKITSIDALLTGLILT